MQEIKNSTKKLVYKIIIMENISKFEKAKWHCLFCKERKSIAYVDFSNNLFDDEIRSRYSNAVDREKKAHELYLKEKNQIK